MSSIPFICIMLGIFKTTACCKKYVPDVNIPEGTYPHFSIREPKFSEKAVYVNRPVNHYMEFQKHIESKCTCGLRNGKSREDKVYGGSSTLPNEYPFQVAIVVKNTRVSTCGGSLINSHFVLTAAHCVLNVNGGGVRYALQESKDIQILLHAHNLNIPNEVIETLINGARKSPEEIIRLDKEDGVIRRNPGAIIVHPGYLRTLQRNAKFDKKIHDDDIALIQLDKPVELKGENGPYTSCLPDSDHFDEYNKERALLIGWGRTNPDTDAHSSGTTLQKLQIPIQDMGICQSLASFRISYHFVCVGSGIRGMDAGKGDSGGPLLLKLNNARDNSVVQYVQIGVASFQNKFVYTAYVRVTEYLQWIYSHVLKLEEEGNKITWCKAK